MASKIGHLGLNMLGINLGKRRGASKEFCRTMAEGSKDLAFVQEPNAAKFKEYSGIINIGSGLRMINNDH